MIYLDNAATSFPKSEKVYAEMDRVNRNLSVNPGRGSYKAAREASAIISELREALLSVFHAKGIASVILTPSITHAVNEVLTGLNLKNSDVVYITPYEHNAVARCVELLRKRIDFKVQMIPLQDDLRIDLEKMKYMFSVNPPTHVIMNALSNVTGYVLPVMEICEAAKQYECITMIDTAQAAGVIDISMIDLKADIVFFMRARPFFSSLYHTIGVKSIRSRSETENLFFSGFKSFLSFPRIIAGEKRKRPRKEKKQ